MIVRSARGTDWKALLELIKEAHGRSNVARNHFDEKYCKEFCLTLMMANQKKPVHDGGHIFVAEHDGVLHGYVIVAAQRLQVFGSDLMVSDLQTYVRKGGHPRAYTKLWNAVENWANVPEVYTVQPALTDVIGDPERTAKFFERRGFKRMGLILEKRRQHVAQRRVA